MIITNNEDALRVECKSVSLDEVGTLIDTLEKELEYANRLGKGGIGLAAPQIGLAKDIAIIRFGEHKINLVNAKITNKYDEFIFRDEGCLSFPGRVEDTNRFQEISVDGNLIFPHGFIATGFLAVVVQHELDHLTKKLFFDYKVVKHPQLITEKVISKKVGPNEQCYCGSGKKFKKCHSLIK